MKNSSRTKRIPKIDLVLLNYNDAQGCLEFIERHKKIASIGHIVVVDNNSTDDSVSKLRAIVDERVVLIENEKNDGYAAGNNIGIEYAVSTFGSDFLVVSNADVFFDDECIAGCVRILDQNEDLLVCAPRMKNPSGQVQNCAWNIATWFRYSWETLPLTKKKRTLFESDYEGKPFVICDCVAGSFFVTAIKRIKRNFFFDPNTFLYCEETILGFLNGPKKAASITDVFFVHAHSQSISKTYKKALNRQKELWNSKYYVFKAYYRIGFFKMALVKGIRFLSLLFALFRKQ